MRTKKMFAKFTGMATFNREKGASSLEYLMLGAVVIAILIAVIGLNDDIASTISTTLQNLFGDVEEAATP
ncbi:MAG: Flp/Fap pilin component [Marinobacter excellens HL-55]|uniref:Flp/Fap pilin component n=1 Tax=Marinobacter excellens HL-55 TaxID=1305731 RepID=A0A0P8D081_9GAMM|nr:MAG: Flp/Fap pilin component [Marinobacter excellens HL-55]